MRPDDLVNTPVPRGLFWAGIVTCILFAVIAVIARGVRWDESYEHAQILAGQVTYPPGHPLVVYVYNAFSLQTGLAGLALKCGMGPLLFCSIRNVLFLLATLLPVYVITTTIARSVLAGLLTAVLLLQGLLLEFDGSYPTMVWPALYSNGHIGGGVVLLALGALLMRAHRSAWFLLGLIPAIHIGQWPPLVATLAAYAAWLGYLKPQKHQNDPTPLPSFKVLLTMLLIGLAITALFFVIQRPFIVSPATEGPFAISGDAKAVWQGYTADHDPHRQFPPGNGHVILIGTLLLGGLGARFGRDATIRRCCTWITVYAGSVALAVWCTMAIHAWKGADIPFLLIAWMPYRLINHMPSLTLAVMCAVLIVRWPIRGWWITGIATTVLLSRSFWIPHLPPTMATSYFHDGAWVAFGLYGATLLALTPTRRKDRQQHFYLVLAALVALACYHRFGAACVFLGLVCSYLITRNARREPVFFHPILFVPVLVLLLGVPWMVTELHRKSITLPVSAFESRIAAQLDTTETPLLLASPDNILLQAKTGIPVLAEAATPSLISYLPEIGPAIDTLYRDLYGYGFTRDDQKDAFPLARDILWQGRSTEEWRTLAQRYGFTHVITPASWSLNLDRLLAEEDYALYAVPDSGKKRPAIPQGESGER